MSDLQMIAGIFCIAALAALSIGVLLIIACIIQEIQIAIYAHKHSEFKRQLKERDIRTL